jgi:hypothetical protein
VEIRTSGSLPYTHINPQTEVYTHINPQTEVATEPTKVLLKTCETFSFVCANCTRAKHFVTRIE